MYGLLSRGMTRAKDNTARGRHMFNRTGGKRGPRRITQAWFWRTKYHAVTEFVRSRAVWVVVGNTGTFFSAPEDSADVHSGDSGGSGGDRVSAGSRTSERRSVGAPERGRSTHQGGPGAPTTTDAPSRDLRLTGNPSHSADVLPDDS
ncbi:hypothetical protein [Streptomyces sp. NPDC058739]|uniref:hypothetical protein n=1 Tax=Streptomyces sp. NPDC058739 TaxID=3346618 RepID=UPI00368ACFAC